MSRNRPERALRAGAQERFVAGLLGVLLLAFLAPGLGAPDGILRARATSTAGVAVVFFLQGLGLRTRELIVSAREVRLHAFVQAWIFLLSAVVLSGAAALMQALSWERLADGFLYLALLPTTITSAVVFTGAAGGNVPASLFNVTLANLLGVVWVPGGCMLAFAAGGGFRTELMGPMLLGVARLIVVPLLAGQLLRPLVAHRAWFASIAPRFRIVNHAVVLFIVFVAFCQGVSSKAWQGVEAGSILALVATTLGALLLIHAGVWMSSAWVTPRLQDRIAALYCGSQKTLAAGAPMAAALFSPEGPFGQVSLAVLLLPLLCYHPLQLLLAALLVPRLQARRGASP